MGVVDRFVSAGPADSRRVRMVFYLGEGLMIGAMLYWVVLLLSSASALTGSELIAGPSLLVVGFFAVFFFVILVRDVGAAVLAGREMPRSWVDEEWKATRRWQWHGVVAIPVLLALIGLTILLWGWEWGSLSSRANLLGYATLGVGIVLRWGVGYFINSQKQPTQED